MGAVKTTVCGLAHKDKRGSTAGIYREDQHPGPINWRHYFLTTLGKHMPETGMTKEGMENYRNASDECLSTSGSSWGCLEVSSSGGINRARPKLTKGVRD